MEQANLSGGGGKEPRGSAESDGRHSENAPSSGATTESDERGSKVDRLQDSDVDDWIAKQETQGESYGYFHLFIVAESSLTGIDRYLRYQYEINHPGPNESQSELRTRFGTGGSRPETAHNQLINWKLSKLAIPLHPELRDVPADRLRVFVAYPAREVLREQDVEIDPVVEKLNQVDEHFPSKGQIERHRKYIEAKEATRGGSGHLKQRIHAVEKTIRASLDFSSRYGGEVPEPDSEYQHLGIGELKEELRDAREEIRRTEQREEEFGQQITEERSGWQEAMRSELFSRSP